MDLDEDIVTMEAIQEAYSYLKTSDHVVRTPTMKHVQRLFNDWQHVRDTDLYLKMENMQNTGSFKIRGCANLMWKLQAREDKDLKLVTFSGGNFGKAFASTVRGTGVKAICLMPTTVPKYRIAFVEDLGVEVRLHPTPALPTEADRLAQQGYVLCKPFDDLDTIAGNASAALELLEEVPDPDVILVCCGGGGLVSAVAATVSLSGIKDCKVYAVEPEGAPTMYQSFQQRRPVSIPTVHSVAGTLCPPFAGEICYRHCRWFVQDVLLVSDAEILQAMQTLFDRGIKAEPAGCAGLAAILFNKVPDVAGKKVVVFITGGNVTCSELAKLLQEDAQDRKPQQ